MTSLQFRILGSLNLPAAMALCLVCLFLQKVYSVIIIWTGIIDVPDSFFTPTLTDLQAAQAVLAARTKALTAPLQLRATREANEKAKLEKWPNVWASVDVLSLLTS
jgi:hypothetical protein